MGIAKEEVEEVLEGAEREVRDEPRSVDFVKNESEWEVRSDYGSSGMKVELRTKSRMKEGGLTVELGREREEEEGGEE